MEEIRGKIKSFLYEAKDSEYKVFKVLDDEKTEYTLLGNIPKLPLELDYIFYVNKIDHKKYGTQYRVFNFKKSDNVSRDGLIAYLSSSKFPGIGVKTAENIFDTLGSDCLKKIREDKRSLELVSGLSPSKIELLYEELKENNKTEQTYIELYDAGLTSKMIGNLVTYYGDETLMQIKTNPYKLLHDVDGFGFIKTDNLAASFSVSYDNENRIKEGIIYALKSECIERGFTFLTNRQLLEASLNVLNNTRDEKLNEENITSQINILLDSNEIVVEQNRIYPANLYNAEISLAEDLKSLSDEKLDKFTDENIISKIEEVEKVLNINYTQKQKEALFKIANSKVSIITGGPGSGKTTLIKGMLYLYCYLNKFDISDPETMSLITLCAPTGRAAKRITEQTKFMANTIHKTLGYDYNLEFCYSKENKLPTKLVIVDEFSMVDVDIASKLIAALPSSARLIIVGDKDQLPSIGPGNVLEDIINSEAFTTIELKEILRQSADSQIISFANMINNRFINTNLFIKKKDIFFYNKTQFELLSFMEKILNNYLSVKGNTFSDLAILVPMYKGSCGIDAINYLIQSKYNKHKTSITRKDKTFKLHDKVMQLKNSPELKIMNGDIGEIIEIKQGEESYITIDFDGMIVKYGDNFDDLTLAYAISIHKSQGSEYKVVLLPIVKSYSIMLKKKLIYTAVTRAKEKLIICGELELLNSSILKQEDIRQTSLVRRLINISSAPEQKILDPDIPFDTLGEEHMEGITPYTFMDDTK